MATKKPRPGDADSDEPRPALDSREYLTKVSPAKKVTGTARPRRPAKTVGKPLLVTDAPPRPRKKAAKRSPTKATNVRMVGEEPTAELPPIRPSSSSSSSSTTPVSGPSSVVPGPRRGRRVAIDRGAAMDQASQYANRQAYMAAHGKPSIVGRATGGAAGGAAAGASVGGPVGAGVGAAVGGITGGIGGARAKRDYNRAVRRPNPARRILIAELIVCSVVGALAPLGEAKKDEKPGAWAKRMFGILGLFLVLGLLSAAGRGAAKVAAAFGGLVTVVLLVSRRDVFMQLAKTLNNRDDKDAPGPGPGIESRTIPNDLGNTEVNPTGSGPGRKSTIARRVK